VRKIILPSLHSFAGLELPRHIIAKKGLTGSYQSDPNIGNNLPSVLLGRSAIATVLNAGLWPRLRTPRRTKTGARLAKWTDWKAIPGPGEGDFFVAPFGPGCYEFGSARASSSYSDRPGMSPSACAPERNEATVAYVTKVHATVPYRLFWRHHFDRLTPGGPYDRTATPDETICSGGTRSARFRPTVGGL